MRLVLTSLAAMLGAGMGLAFYGLGTLDGTARSGVGGPTLPLPTPLPTATSAPTPTSTSGLPVVLVATMTPSPTATYDPNPPTPFIRPTATPYPVCGPHLDAGRVCRMPEPAPTNDVLPEQP